MIALAAKWKLYAALAAAAVVVGGVLFGAGAIYGANEATVSCLEDERERERDHQRELTAANERTRAKEREHEQVVSELRRAFAQESEAQAARDAAVAASLRDGNRRLRLQVAAARCPTPEAGAVAPAAGADEAPRAELAPEAASALFGITADGDAAIRQLTGLQDYAAKLYRDCTGANE